MPRNHDWNLKHESIIDLLTNDLQIDGIAITANNWKTNEAKDKNKRKPTTNKRPISLISSSVEEEISDNEDLILLRSGVAVGDTRSRSTLMKALLTLQVKFRKGIHPAMFDLRPFSDKIKHGRQFDLVVYFHAYVCVHFRDMPFNRKTIISIVNFLWPKKDPSLDIPFPVLPKNNGELITTTYTDVWTNQFMHRYHCNGYGGDDYEMQHVMFLCASEQLQNVYFMQNGPIYLERLLQHLKEFIVFVCRDYKETFSTHEDMKALFSDIQARTLILFAHCAHYIDNNNLLIIHTASCTGVLQNTHFYKTVGYAN